MKISTDLITQAADIQIKIGHGVSDLDDREFRNAWQGAEHQLGEAGETAFSCGTVTFSCGTVTARCINSLHLVHQS